jgi:predicted AlkP superfamily phosphohydrolase/phosphomutase
LFLTVFSETHSAAEVFWHGVDEGHLLHDMTAADEARRGLEEVYAAVDEAIGEITASLGPTDLAIIFSIHGVKQNTGDVPSGLLLPELLHRLNGGSPVLDMPDTSAWRATGMQPVVPSVGEWPPIVNRRWDAETPIGKLKRVVRSGLPPRIEQKVLATSDRIRGRRNAAFPSAPSDADNELTADPSAYGVPMGSLHGHVATWYRKWWPNMRAFALPSFGEGRIRLNVAGRESQGSIPQESYGETIEGLRRTLADVRDPRTGAPAVAGTTPFEGDPTEARRTDCDLVVSWADNIDAIDHPTTGVIGPFRLIRTGGHTSNGFCLFHKPTGTAAPGGSYDVADLPATIMELLGGTATESGRPMKPVIDLLN